MIQIILSVVCLVAMVNSVPWAGVPYYPGGLPYYTGAYSGGHPYDESPYGRWIYYGKFGGSCEGSHDGLYYVDDYSFAYCSNGQKTIQPCAEGSANPSLGHFHRGNYYGLYDFCSINLVDFGYNAHQGHYVDKPIPHKNAAYKHNSHASHYVKGDDYIVKETKAYQKKEYGQTANKVEEHVSAYKHQAFEEPKKTVYG